MNIIFKYSFKKEITEAFNVVLHFMEYKNLRSVIWPRPRNIIKFVKQKNSMTRETEKVWRKIAPAVKTAFKKYKLKELGTVTCFVHGISCEGWFDVDENSIHIRLIKYGTKKNLIDTIIHELLHLATYKDIQSYEEREATVDNLLSKPEFRNLISAGLPEADVV